MWKSDVLLRRLYSSHAKWRKSLDEPNMKIADAWIVTTSNNQGSIDAETHLYDAERDAISAAESFNLSKAHDRADWIAIRLSEAIQNAIDDACANASDEG